MFKVSWKDDTYEEQPRTGGMCISIVQSIAVVVTFRIGSGSTSTVYIQGLTIVSTG